MSFTLQDLGLAYRKAKVDLYYSSYVSVRAIAVYEEKLVENLQRLLDKLNSDNEEWIKESEFLGDWTVATKSISWDERKKFRDKNGNGSIFSSPSEEWKSDYADLVETKKINKPTAEFRLMAECSLDFHVLSALWMIKVGDKYDKKLSNAAYGNRLRRGKNGEYNLKAMGSFKPYLKPFRDWRDGGIKVMRAALIDKKKVSVLTADVSSFYHELNPNFMLNPAFNELFGDLELTPEMEKLHRLFIVALHSWAQNTPLEKGLPVGLPASGVVANMALIELDQLIERQVVPLYYGRYVDDIILVMENAANIRSTVDLWEWLFKRFENKILSWKDGETEHKTICFQPDYLKESNICFANDKNKVFLLDGETGQTLVDTIDYQIRQRASEWRAFPDLPASARHVSTNLIAATQSDGDAADNLRKTDVVTMRRAGFAINLRDFEAYERDLLPNAWQDLRYAFFDAFIQHVLVLPRFFDLAVYLPRVVRLATACEDFEYLCRIINRLKEVSEEVEKCCKIIVKSYSKENPISSEIMRRWKQQIDLSVCESIFAAFPPSLVKKSKIKWNKVMGKIWEGLCFYSFAVDIKGIQTEQARLFSHDLAHMPFRFIGLPREMIAQRGIPPKSTVQYVHRERGSLCLDDHIITGIDVLAGWVRLDKGDGLPYGLLFATRPFNLAEISVVAKNPFDGNSLDNMRLAILALRGFDPTEAIPKKDKDGVLKISNGESKRLCVIAVSNWKTNSDSLIASIMRSPDPKGVDRYFRLSRLVNSLIMQPKRVDYLVLPELALPAHWFMRLAQKLQGRSISLITGIEYLHANKKRVRNQVWAALSHDGFGFPSSVVYRQDKQRPALHEEQELKQRAGLEMKPEAPWEKPLIIQHGEFRFALLICSELTNIGYRAALRGRVDALFVPEWNQDTETFNALVESAALDVHAYIIQCNDRRYGDSRIRAPSKDSWRRDVLRAKGGVADYYVIGEIDIYALRRFQSNYQSPNKNFKPVPDGFEIVYDRKMLPTGSNSE
jgi:hypothetical protein